jgi:hypothetical protein
LAPSNPYGKENTEVEQFGLYSKALWLL